ncbi:MAG: hypothetical protein ABJK25_04175 [Halieaceae bacterium]
MADDWLSRFEDFSRSIDFVDQAIFEDVTALLEKAFKESWRICFFRALMSGHSIRIGAGDVPALSTIWSKDDSETDFQIAGADGAAVTLTSYSLLQRKELWITAADGGKLVNHISSSEGLVDQWPGLPGLPELPPYVDYRGSVARTMVILPLEYGMRMFGVVCLEFNEYITISSRAKLTATTFAKSLARIIWLRETNKTQLDDSKEALALLHSRFLNASDAFQRRRVFLASSGEESGGAVIETIRKILSEEYSELFELDYWEEESASGAISDQVRASIASAEFGICYLSEKISDEPLKYFDNPNVLFEAGMFQMLHELRDSADDIDAARWLPIREGEQLTTSLPFDIAGDRMLVVPRSVETGEVNIEKFGDDLRKAINSLVVALQLD